MHEMYDLQLILALYGEGTGGYKSSSSSSRFSSQVFTKYASQRDAVPRIQGKVHDRYIFKGEKKIKKI